MAATRRAANTSLCSSSLERLSASPPTTVAPVASTAPVSLSRLLPGLRANVQKTAACLPRIAGRLEIGASAHGVCPTTNSPCTHVPMSTMSASWIAA